MIGVAASEKVGNL